MDIPVQVQQIEKQKAALEGKLIASEKRHEIQTDKVDRLWAQAENFRQQLIDSQREAELAKQAERSAIATSRRAQDEVQASLNQK
eukprot:627566-Amorphochlora_amoeboformis.AAC.1